MLVTLASPEHKQLFGALGFTRLPVEYPPIWGMQLRIEAYMLDVQRIGFEAWIEALVAGRRPPRVFSSDELERALQDALLHWQDDAWLVDSALAESVAVASLVPPQHGAEAVREAITQALQRVSADAPPELALAYRALQSAYIARTGNHEHAAEELAVSRTTFYRLLRRASRGLAHALQNG